MSDKKVSKMAEYLRKGATMLSYNCPVCNQPLFRYKGDIYCVNCNKKVKIVKEGEEAKEHISELEKANLLDVENSVLVKIKTLNDLLVNEVDIYKLEPIAKQLILWLEVLEKLKKIRGN